MKWQFATEVFLGKRSKNSHLMVVKTYIIDGGILDNLRQSVACQDLTRARVNEL